MLDRVVRPVGLDEVPAVRALLDRDPVVNVFVTARLDAALRRAGLDELGRRPGSTETDAAADAGDGRTGGGRVATRQDRATVTRRVLLDRTGLGGELWAYAPSDAIEALCFVGGNVVPIGAGPPAIEAFGAALRRQPRWAASLVGPAETVLPLWQLLSRSWGPGREVRADQPLLVADGPPLVEPDRQVRRRGLEDLDALFPASVAMFTEEVGVSPMGSDGGATYRARLREMIGEGHSLARIDPTPEGPQVTFKAEIGYATRHACQVQGVWVPPHRRGEGLGVAGMAAVVDIARRDIAPVVSLYVNDYNAAARAVYDRVGFRRVGTFATVLL